MPVTDLYFYRKEAASIATDVFLYDELPSPLRVQIAMIMRDAIGRYASQADYYAQRYWDGLHDLVCRELGRYVLSSKHLANDEDILEFVRTGQPVDEVLGVVKAGFRLVDRLLSNKDASDRRNLGIKQEAADAIDELNLRFLRAGVGYQYADGDIMRVDAMHLHQEAVCRPCGSWRIHASLARTASLEMLIGTIGRANTEIALLTL